MWRQPFSAAWSVWILVHLVALTGCAACGRAPVTAIPTAEDVEINNRGVGLMGQFDFEAAVGVFDGLSTAAPEWAVGRLNLAIALLNRQGESDAARAEALLRELVRVPGVDRRARYVLGLLLLHEGREGDALPLIDEVANGDPPDGFAAYFAGQLRLTKDPSEALARYRRAAELQPLLRNAYYGAFLALRRLDREAEAEATLARFQALERHPQALVAELKYTRMGPLAEAMVVDAAMPAAAPPIAGPRFSDAMPLVADTTVTWRPGGPPRSITIADLDQDQAMDVFIADALASGPPNAVLFNRAGGFVLDRGHPLAGVSGVSAALWGDLDDDGLVDVVLCRRSGTSAVWRQVTAGRWVETTAASGLGASARDVVDGAVIDADHDGDLDIWLVSRTGPTELWSNDGGVRFRSIGAIAGVSGDGRPSRGLALADLDGDRDLDVMVIKDRPPHDVFLNDRVWEYRRDDGAMVLAAAPVSAVVAADLDADGSAELYSDGAGGIERWRRDPSGSWRPERIVEGGTAAEARLAIADTDGDGRLELLRTAAGGWAIVDAAVPSGAGSAASDGAAAPGGWTVAHLDPGAGPSIVGVREDGAPVIWRPGSGRHQFLGVWLTGRDPTSDQRRSNVSGLGARVALRSGSRWTAFDTTRLESGPGQSLQPMSVGLGGNSRADFAAITWSDGVFQTELGLAGGRLHRIAETQRQLSSCPVVFAWDGTRFRFVTDVLGVGGLGFFERPGRYSTPYPQENLLLPQESIAESDGTYRLAIAEPMEEVTYLDSAALVAYDLPPGWRMALDERKAVSGAQPTGAPIFYRQERVPVRAATGEGEDVTSRIRTTDLDAAGPPQVDPRFIGLAREYSITVEFDGPIYDGPGRPVLLADGWVEYPYAQTVFAAWQAGAAYEAPTLEARDDRGRWHEVAREFGYPAGMPRQMAMPLPELPPGTRALRLRTTLEIYWDRIAIAYAEAAPDVHRRTLPLSEAWLEEPGFARRTTGPQRAPHYDYERQAPLADTRHPRGWYSAFGPVGALVAEQDHALAIFGPGEAVTLTFEAPASPPVSGWTRRLVLEARGWCKDMDLYTRDGETVGPLPGEETSARARLHPLFNTRYAGGL